MKTNHVLGAFGLNLLVAISILVVSLIVAPAFDQAFAVKITSGTYISDTEYEMKAYGKDYYSREYHDGDDYVAVIDGTSLRINDAWVKYVFQIPAELYDHRLIEQFRVTFRHDRTDAASSNTCAYGDAYPVKLCCYDYQNREYDNWKNLTDTGDGVIRTVVVTTPGIYEDDDQEHIGVPGSGYDEYEIWFKIDAPDGAGGADCDDDGNTDINDIVVTLILKQPHAPGLRHTAPDTGTNGKVNVPTGASTRFEVSVDALSASGYAVTEYHWKQQSATEAPPSLHDDFDFPGDQNYTDLTFDNSGNYVVYCKVVHKETVNSTQNRDLLLSDVLSIPVRVWDRPTVHDSPPQARIDAGDVSWYSDKYVGVKGQPVRLMAEGAPGSTDTTESVVRFLWDFDNNWETDDPEQPADSIASRTWENPNESAQIRCKAVTNYGMESAEKSFNLKIYDTVQVDPGGPYTGRVNSAVELAGSMSNSYQNATVAYQWRVNSATPGWMFYGNAVSQGDSIRLTEALSGQSGQVDYESLSLSDSWSVTGEFWSGGGSGADAFYIYVWANGIPTNESGSNGQYSIVFDEWDDEVQLYDASSLLKMEPQPISIDNSQWRPFRVVFDHGAFEVYLDYKLKLEYDVGTGYEARKDDPANIHFGFGAHTVALNNLHLVRDMKWTPGDPVQTDNRGEAEHTWTSEATHRAGFTVQVTTSEGLVLEETASVEVQVEAGKPTAMPGGPYRGGIAGGDFSPIPFEGNHPDFVEADDVGLIEEWMWFFPDNGNGALELDGQDDHVIVNPVSGFPTTAITVGFWMKSSDDSRSGTPISYAVAGQDNEVSIFDYGNFSFRIAGDSTGASGVSANDGKWHHIAMTWQSADGILQLYKDGVEAFRDTIAQGESITQGGAFVVGQDQDAIGGGFDRSQAFAGRIDEVMVWSEVRSADQIRQDMTGDLTGSETQPMLYYKFEEGEGSVAGDETDQNDGTLVVHSVPEAWVGDGHPFIPRSIWNPSHSYPFAGAYKAGLKVLAESGKWSATATADVEVIEGKIAGYVRAADLRTPVREVRLILTSTHVDRDALALAVSLDSTLHTTDTGGLWTETDSTGQYAFPHLPLGSYRIVATKGEGDAAHEFEKSVQATELTLNGPNQLAIDFVDLSVFPVGGRIVYSIQKNGKDVLVDGVEVTAQPIGSTSGICALPSTKSVTATNTNYSLPLFAGKYLFFPRKEGHDVCIKENTPGYDSNTGLVTIKGARTDVDFEDQTTRKLTVYVEDSGGNPITHYPDNYSNAGDSIVVTVSGLNGQLCGADAQIDSDAKLETDLNPGEYTVEIEYGIPKGEDSEGPAEVDLTSEDGSVTMIIPVQIELSFVIAEDDSTYKPKLFDVESEAFLEQFGLTADDNPEGYMYYYAPEPRTHTYTIQATANGNPVEDFTLSVRDDVSMMTEDAAVEEKGFVDGHEGTYTIVGGLPKQTDGEPPLAAPKMVRFRAEAEGYEDSESLEDSVIVLGERLVGTASKIVSIPVVNYTVLHDPPGDGSYSFMEDTVILKGMVKDMMIQVDPDDNDSGWISVYPSAWSREREVEDFTFEKTRDSDTEFNDMKDHGLLGYRQTENMAGYFVAGSLLESVTGFVSIASSGKTGFAIKLAKLGLAGAKVLTGGSVLPGIHFVQYEVSPHRRLQTPSGDDLPDLVGPGKGDIYYGEGWTLGLQSKYFMGIQLIVDGDGAPILDEHGNKQWELMTEQIETYDIMERTNQYVYSIRDIERIIEDLEAAIVDIGEDPDEEEEKNKLTDARNTWNTLLNNNKAYVWNRDYVPWLHDLNEEKRRTFEDFQEEKGLTNRSFETLIFSAGPAFEYSRRIYEGDISTYSANTTVGSWSSISGWTEVSAGFNFHGTGVTMKFSLSSDVHIVSDHTLGREWESGQETEQTVGFVLQDDDVGDNISTRVTSDPRWGTPLFFQDAGSYTSDPWEAGTNKAVDFTMEVIKDTTGTFDYYEGAHYKLKLKYTGQRSLENGGYIDFLMYDYLTDQEDNPTVRFNGDMALYRVKLTKQTPIATVNVSIYPADLDKNNSGEKQYTVKIIAEEEGDQHINRSVTMTPTFADLRAPRAVIAAPYEGERISPVFFPAEDPFKVVVLSEDTDLASIQLQIRSKQPDGVWEPWSNLFGMLWEEGGTNGNVTVFDRLERRPPHREFVFAWAEDAIRSLGVGEYALRAVATDKAFRYKYDEEGTVTGTTPTPNRDIAPPSVVFLVDESEPSVLNSIPDYQARESERIYRGELSVTFTDDMRSTDFSDRTFYVMDLLDNNTKVAGYVSYSPALRKTVFVPIVPFQPNGFYRVEIKTDVDLNGDEDFADDGERGVHDLAGNPLDNAFMWTFRTTDAPFEPTWSMNFSVTDGSAMDGNNYAAVAHGALDAEDEKDARAVPGLANQLRMSFLNRDRLEFDRDMRPADGRLSHHWFFVIDHVQSGAEVTLNWTPSIKLTRTLRQYQVIRLVEFGEDGSVTNTVTLDPTEAGVNQETGEIDPVLAHTYTNQGEISRYFRLDVMKVSFVAGTLQAGTSGWKFLSVPITPQRAEPFVNLGDDIDPFQLYQYDTGLGGYKIYPYDIGEVGLQTGHGYFTRLGEDVEVDVGGTSNHDDVTCTLDSVGWHAIGNPFILPVNVAALIVSDGTTDKSFDDAVTAEWVEGTLYRWDIVSKGKAFLSALPLSDGYEAVTIEEQLDLWEGYWLRTKAANLTLTIPAPDGVVDATQETPDYLKHPLLARPCLAMDSREGVSPQFTLSLDLFSESSSDRAALLGTHPDAKAGCDVWDSRQPPIMTHTVAAYFEHTDWGKDSGAYNWDYQPFLEAGQQRTWQLTVYTNRANTPMTLSWEHGIEEAPKDMMLMFREIGEADAQWKDMRQVRSVEVPSSVRITELRFEVRAERFAFYPPSEVQVVAGEEEVFLSWKAEELSNLTGYTIRRWDASGELTQHTLGVNEHQFEDSDVLENADYTYQLSACYKTGAEWHSDPLTVSVKPVIFKTALLPCYPNPFNPEVWIPYELVEEAEVTIRIYNSMGRLVRTLELGVQPRGSYASRNHAAYWDGCTRSGKPAASGVYLYRLEAGTCCVTKKMVLLR